MLKRVSVTYSSAVRELMGGDPSQQMIACLRTAIQFPVDLQKLALRDKETKERCEAFQWPERSDVELARVRFRGLSDEYVASAELMRGEAVRVTCFICLSNRQSREEDRESVCVEIKFYDKKKTLLRSYEIGINSKAEIFHLNKCTERYPELHHR